MPRKLDKRKLCVDKVPSEIVKFVYYVDKEELNRVLKPLGLEVNTEADLENFLKGLTPVGSRHSVDLRQVIAHLKVRPIDVQKADVELV